MVYSLFANIVLILHFCFVLFTVFGGLFVLRWRWVWKLHLPVIIWGFLIQYFLWICPLTILENYFRALAGETGYTQGFIDYFISLIIYPNITPNFHLFLGIALIVFNLFVYSYVIFKSFNKFK